MRKPLALFVLASFALALVACHLTPLPAADPTPEETPAPTVVLRGFVGTSEPTPRDRIDATTPYPTKQREYLNCSARDEGGLPLPGAVVNIWSDYVTRTYVVGQCSDGELVEILARRGDGVLIRTSRGATGWVSRWFLRQ